MDLLAACGIPPGLLTANTDGTAQRESYRRFLHTVVLPRGRIVERELTMKLGGEVRLDPSMRLMASLTYRAAHGRLRAMVNGGMALERAAALSGLLVVADD